MGLLSRAAKRVSNRAVRIESDDWLGARKGPLKKGGYSFDTSAGPVSVRIGSGKNADVTWQFMFGTPDVGRIRAGREALDGVVETLRRDASLTRQPAYSFEGMTPAHDRLYGKHLKDLAGEMGYRASAKRMSVDGALFDRLRMAQAGVIPWERVPHPERSTLFTLRRRNPVADAALPVGGGGLLSQLFASDAQ